MNDCKTCKHAQVLYAREKADRFAAAYAPINYVRCAGPRYKGRAYFVKATRKACGEYLKRERHREKDDPAVTTDDWPYPNGKLVVPCTDAHTAEDGDE